MAEQQLMYIRKGRTMKAKQEGLESKTFEFVNEAKRFSREVQMQNGGLGAGAVMREGRT